MPQPWRFNTYIGPIASDVLPLNVSDLPVLSGVQILPLCGLQVFRAVIGFCSAVSAFA